MTPAYKLTSDGSSAVAPECHWIPVGPDTPRGVNIWMINRRSNVALKGQYHGTEDFFDYWFPLPTFKKL